MANQFWDESYGGDDFTNDSQPNPFIKEQATLIPPNSEVIEIGAGQGRNAVYLAELGHTVTAIDSSAGRLGKLKSLAAERAVSIRSIHQDILTWENDQQWDAAIMTFMQMSEDDRSKLYERIQQLLRPNGFLISLFFRPEHVTEGYPGGGGVDEEVVVTTEELEEHFTKGKILRAENAERMLDEEEFQQGEAAVIEFIFQKQV